MRGAGAQETLRPDIATGYGAQNSDTGNTPSVVTRHFSYTLWAGYFVQLQSHGSIIRDVSAITNTHREHNTKMPRFFFSAEKSHSVTMSPS